MDSAIGSPNTYLLDRDLFQGIALSNVGTIRARITFTGNPLFILENFDSLNFYFTAALRFSKERFLGLFITFLYVNHTVINITMKDMEQ